VIRLLTELRSKHAEYDGLYFGINGNVGEIADMREIDIWEPFLVKS